VDDERAATAAPLEALVTAVCDGPPDQRSAAGGELVRRFEPALRRLWSQYLRRYVDLEYEDYAQDVFLRVLSQIGSLRVPAAFPGYFQRTARNVAIDCLRRRAARPTSEAPIDPDSFASRVDESLLASVLVRSYLDQLPGRERDVLDLEFVRGLDPAEIMARTGLTRGGISAAKTRGIRRLQEIMGKEAARLRAQMS
jgi:RNA polymerase sigma factor (sigma-70 family)